MNRALKRGGRVRRLVLSSLALLVAVSGLAAVSAPPAQAGDAGADRILIAGIYNQTPVPLHWVEGWSDWGWSRAFQDAPSAGGALFGLYGSPLTYYTNWCDDWSNSYNGWFTYRADIPGGTSEFVTISIYGTRKKPTILGCSGDTYPAVEVFMTTTAPPITWRHGTLPPNLDVSPQLAYQHNTPYLFDQTITWRGSGPGEGAPAIVSLGDSTISGEGGRWAGNTNSTDSSRIDAGAQTYWDTPTGESFPTCHRSTSAEVHIGGGVLSQNFACSAAETHSYDWQYPQGWRFKPGVDTHCELPDGSPPPSSSDPAMDPGVCLPSRSGQLIQLGLYARTHNVKAIVLAVGANDFDFSGVWKQCALIYEQQHVLDTGKRCYNSGVMQSAITDANRATIEQDIWESLRELTVVMADAGYDRTQYTVILQNYWSAIPDDEDIRIPDVMYDRQSEGGCPLLYGDASALNDVLLPAINRTVLAAATRFRYEPYWPAIRLLDVSGALVGHRLCEKGVGEIEDYPSFTGRGTDPSMADKLEWVTQARSATVIGAPYTLAEGGHANYWGQLAERNCLRQAYNNGSPRDGKCVPAAGGGVDSQGEPNMTLQPYSW